MEASMRLPHTPLPDTLMAKPNLTTLRQTGWQHYGKHPYQHHLHQHQEHCHDCRRHLLYLQIFHKRLKLCRSLKNITKLEDRSK
jgi:hypothetical protein